MITIAVLSFNGAPPSPVQSFDFDEFGGTLGRSPDCDLVLSDENRGVSRIHGKISYRDNKFVITDEGTNPLKVNGVPVGKGNSTAINDGDRIIIGPYELAVRDGPPVTHAKPSAQDDFSDIKGISSPATPPPGPVPQAPTRAPAASRSDNPFGDFLGAGESSGEDKDPFNMGAASEMSSGGGLLDDLDFGSASSPLRDDPLAAVPSPRGELPDDFDPMAPLPSSKNEGFLPPAGADLPDDAFEEFGMNPKAPGEGSLDAMFGLSSGASSDPFANSPLGKAPPSHQGGTDSGLTQWIGGIKGQDADSRSDAGSELSSAFQPPKATPQKPAPSVPDAPSLPDFEDFSAQDSDAPSPAATAPKIAPKLPEQNKAKSGEPSIDDLLGDLNSGVSDFLAPELPAKQAAPDRKVPAAVVAAPPAAPRPSVDPASLSPDLLQAFLQGLNGKDLKIDQLTPELMFKVGTLLNEATSGTVALLSARGSVKREMRADVTMIASGSNNPLKFSPDAGVALRYMFGEPMPGFMDAEEAMQDAYNDLRAHEFGFMAGLRAALADVLQRFEPARLEARLPEKGGVGSLLSSSRKARLWDQFGLLYKELSLEAEEDFHALFGREFLRAYEQHIRALAEARARQGK